MPLCIAFKLPVMSFRRTIEQYLNHVTPECFVWLFKLLIVVKTHDVIGQSKAFKLAHLFLNPIQKLCCVTFGTTHSQTSDLQIIFFTFVNVFV